MSWLESIVYGFISGLAEFLPISSRGHQIILIQIFGVSQLDPVRSLFIYLGVLLALITCCASMIGRFRREAKLAERYRHSRTAHAELKTGYDMRLLKTAAVPLLLGLLLNMGTSNIENNPVWVILFFLINGTLMFVVEHIRHGNKDARSMSGFDAILIGISSALSVLPGISRVGINSLTATARGADRQHALNWALMLSIPALILLCGFDVLRIIGGQYAAASFSVVLGYILSTVFAFAGAYSGILIMRFLTVRTGYSGFAYYSWGAAMLLFVLYLIA